MLLKDVTRGEACFEEKNAKETVFYMKTDCLPPPYWSDAALYSILQRGIDSENK